MEGATSVYSRFLYEKRRPLFSPLDANVHDLATHFLPMIVARFRRPPIYIYIYVERTQDKPPLRRVEQGKTRVVEIPSHVSRITSV